MECVKIEDENLEKIKKELADMIQNITKLHETPPELISLDDIDIWKDEVRNYPNRLSEIIRMVNRDINRRNKEKVF